MGICLSFPVLTHGSWGTVRHLLAFAPTNPHRQTHTWKTLLLREPHRQWVSLSSLWHGSVSGPQGPYFFCKSLAGHSTHSSVERGLTQHPSSCVEPEFLLTKALPESSVVTRTHWAPPPAVPSGVCGLVSSTVRPVRMEPKAPKALRCVSFSSEVKQVTLQRPLAV